MSISLTSPELSGSGNVAFRLIDVSAVGACLQTTSCLREGMSLAAELTLPGPRGGRFGTRGTVRWSQVIPSKEGEIAVCGIEFETVLEALAGRTADSSLLDIFLTLRVAVAQLRLYPKESPQVLKVVTDTYHSIHSFLENAPTLTLSKTPRGLLVNGRPLGMGGTMGESLESAMIGLLTDAQVKSITFRKGVTLDELITFLHALTKKFWDVKDGKEINKRLRDQRVLQISVDEVTYVALGEGDIVIEDAARKLAGGETELSKLMGSLDQLIESAGSEGLGAEGRIHVMKKLLDQDPTLLSRIAESTGKTVGGGGSGPEETEEGRIHLDQARDAIGEIARLLRETPDSAHDSLRRIGKILIESFRRNPRLTAMMGALLSSGATEAMPASAQEETVRPIDEPPAVTRATSLLALPDEEKIATLAQEGSALLDELAALERPDLVQNLLGSLSGYFGDRSTKRRLNASRAIHGLRRALEKNAPEERVRALEADVRAALEQERDPSVYPALADVAIFLIDLQIRRGALDRARQITEVLHKHYKIKDPAFAKRGELAYTALERLASAGALTSLSSRLRSGETEPVRIVEAVGAAGTRFLLGEIFRAETSAERIALAGFIARAGAGAATVLLDEIAKATAPTDVLKLLEVLPQAMPGDMAEMALSGLLRHSAVAVRKRTAILVAEQGFPRAGSVLLDTFAAEMDASVKLVIVECLGRLRHRAALDLLSDVIESRHQSEELRAAACVALGKIGDARAVTPLSKLCGKGDRSLTRIFSKVPSPVRAAAVRALAFFPLNPEAIEAIRRAQEDSDAVVRAAAGQARHAPLLDAFGDAAQGVVVISNAADLGGEAIKVGGSFSEIPFEAVCRKIAAAEMQGLLAVRCGAATGHVYFDSGLIIAVEAEGRRDQDAFAAILARREGQFLFLPGESAPERRILVPVDALLEQSSRRRAGTEPVM